MPRQRSPPQRAASATLTIIATHNCVSNAHLCAFDYFASDAFALAPAPPETHPIEIYCSFPGSTTARTPRGQLIRPDIVDA
jgi:hypothetical protein